MRKSVFCFYFPYLSTGGVSSLFAFISKLISEKHKVYLVDFHNGALSLQCKCFDSIHLVTPKDLPQLSFSHDLTIITQLMPVWRLPFVHKVNLSTKLFFWILHPDNFEFIPKYRSIFHIVHTYFPGRINRLSFQLNLFLSKNSLYSMDLASSSGVITTLSLPASEISNIPLLLLIHKPFSEITPHPSFVSSKKKLVVTWIGRLEDFKVLTLIKFAKDLNYINQCSAFDIHLNIIGDGKDMQFIQTYLHTTSLTVVYHGTLQLSEINNVLITTDVGFGMGLSLCEFSSRGIPAIIADFWYSNSESDLSRYHLFGLDRIDTGFPGEFSASFFHDKPGSTLITLINTILSDYTKYSSISLSAYQQHYHYSSSLDLFMSSVLNSDLVVRDIKNSPFSRPDLITIFLSSFFLFINTIRTFRSNKFIYGGFSYLL